MVFASAVGEPPHVAYVLLVPLKIAGQIASSKMVHCAKEIAKGILGVGTLSLPLLALVVGCSGRAAAAEPEKSACSAFCSPVTPGQLDRYRAQGLARPAGDTAVSVILWDEYRGVRPPHDSIGTVPTNGIAVPGGTAFVNTAVSTGYSIR